jgi:hypothetical protein
MELLAGHNSKEARQLLDPGVDRLTAVVHGSEGQLTP